jgi:hypothetical protein
VIDHHPHAGWQPRHLGDVSPCAIATRAGHPRTERASVRSFAIALQRPVAVILAHPASVARIERREIRDLRRGLPRISFHSIRATLAVQVAAANIRPQWGHLTWPFLPAGSESLALPPGHGTTVFAGLSEIFGGVIFWGEE